MDNVCRRFVGGHVIAIAILIQYLLVQIINRGVAVWCQLRRIHIYMKIGFVGKCD